MNSFSFIALPLLVSAFPVQDSGSGDFGSEEAYVQEQVPDTLRGEIAGFTALGLICAFLFFYWIGYLFGCTGENPDDLCPSPRQIKEFFFCPCMFIWSKFKPKADATTTESFV